MALADHYIHSFDVQRESFTAAAGTGAQVPTLTSVITGAAGQFQQQAERYAYQPDGKRAVGSWILFCDSGHDIRNGDRIVWGTRNFDVLDVEQPYDRHLEVTLNAV